MRILLARQTFLFRPFKRDHVMLQFFFVLLMLAACATALKRNKLTKMRKMQRQETSQNDPLMAEVVIQSSGNTDPFVDQGSLFDESSDIISDLENAMPPTVLDEGVASDIVDGNAIENTIQDAFDTSIGTILEGETENSGVGPFASVPMDAIIEESSPLDNTENSSETFPVVTVDSLEYTSKDISGPEKCKECPCTTENGEKGHCSCQCTADPSTPPPPPPPPCFDELVLYNSQADKKVDIPELRNGDTIYLIDHPTLVANFCDDSIKKANFYVNGKLVQSEGYKPFSIAGDDDSGYWPWTGAEELSTLEGPHEIIVYGHNGKDEVVDRIELSLYVKWKPEL